MPQFDISLKPVSGQYSVGERSDIRFRFFEAEEVRVAAGVAGDDDFRATEDTQQCTALSQVKVASRSPTGSSRRNVVIGEKMRGFDHVVRPSAFQAAP